jgi:hypothetical protein
MAQFILEALNVPRIGLTTRAVPQSGGGPVSAQAPQQPLFPISKHGCPHREDMSSLPMRVNQGQAASQHANARQWHVKTGQQ